jgi:hypothetical protein
MWRAESITGFPAQEEMATTAYMAQVRLPSMMMLAKNTGWSSENGLIGSMKRLPRPAFQYGAHEIRGSHLVMIRGICLMKVAHRQDTYPTWRHVGSDQVEAPARVRFRDAAAVMSANSGGYSSLRRGSSVEMQIANPFALLEVFI